MVEAAAILFTVLLAFMEIRHAINGGDVYRDSARPDRNRAAGLRRARDGDRAGAAARSAPAASSTMSARSCSRVFAGAAIVFGLLFLENPMFWPTDVGGVFFNLLLLGYAHAGGAGAAVVLCGGGPASAGYANTIAAGALVLALTYVTFEIRGSITGRC